MTADQDPLPQAVFDADPNRTSVLIGLEKTGPTSVVELNHLEGSQAWLCSRARRAFRAVSADGAITPMVNQVKPDIASASSRRSNEAVSRWAVSVHCGDG